MKRTFLKFSMVVLLMGTFAVLPSCKNEAAEEETTATEEPAMDPAATEAAATTPEDTTKGVVTGTDPAKQP